MKITKLFTLSAFLVSAGIFLLGGCQDGAIAPVDSGGSSLSDNEQLRKLINEDETIQSFEPNYNEEEAMSLAGDGLAKAIFPVRVGHKMTLVNRQVDLDVMEDSAFAVVTNTFEGILFIAASYDEFEIRNSSAVDTLIEKPFTSVVTHNVIFAKRDNFGLISFGNSDGRGGKNGGGRPPHPGGNNGNGPNNGGGKGQNGNDGMGPNGNSGPGDKPGSFGDLDRLDWKIVSVSLPEGGTGSSNIFITKMTITLPDGEEVAIESPNDFYMERIPGRPHQIPSFSQGESILVRVELQSAYADTDFVCLTYGAQQGRGYNRTKKRFELVSESFDGQFYSRTYEAEWISRPDRGPKHAIVRAVPKQVVFDDETIVEVNTWGVPYIVK